MNDSQRILTIEMFRNGGATDSRQFVVGPKRMIKIGKWPASDVRIEDPNAAHLHAVIQLNRAGAMLRDMGAPAGCLVNGERVDKAWLNTGDQLRIGETLLRFTLAAEQPQAANDDGGGALDPWADATPPPQAQAQAAPPAIPAQPECTASDQQPEALLNPLRVELVNRLAAMPDQELLQLQHQLDRQTIEPVQRATDPGIALPEPEQPISERYNTRRLVRQMNRDRHMGRVAALGAFAVIAIVTILPISLTLGRGDMATFQGQVAKPISETAAPKTTDSAATTEPDQAIDKATAADAEAALSQPSDDSFSLYTVKPGDTLGRIAHRTLGDVNQWERIYNANRTVLQSPGSLEVGATLRIPAP